MQTSELEQLLDRVRSGDDEATSEFLDTYGDAVRREARFALLDSRLRRVVSESDVCQSVITLFLVNRSADNYEFGETRDLVGLLKTMVRARVADLARYWTAQKRDVRRNVGVESPMGLRPMPDCSTPSAIVSSSELLDEIRQRLSDGERRIFELRHDRVSWAEIADQLEDCRGPEAARKRYSRALQRIATELGFESQG